MMNLQYKLDDSPHTRLNILTGERVLVSPQRNNRPWQGRLEQLPPAIVNAYEPKCYLCPGNARAEGVMNPDYSSNFIFENDYAALTESASNGSLNEKNLLVATNLNGICKVISFGPRHDQTLPEMDVSQIVRLVDLWQQEFCELATKPWIKYIQIFENKGEVMGCSNPHPHGQIWSQGKLPVEIEKETLHQKHYHAINRRSMLGDYLALELEKKERIVFENEHFVVLVPFWAAWPYETMIISKRHVQSIKYFTTQEKEALAGALQAITIKYDNLFETSFPYSAGIHQAPVNDGHHPEWHWHMHFYPPLLRSATIKKFMVGYELLANPQRDITPEHAAKCLREISSVHYKKRQR